MEPAVHEQEVAERIDEWREDVVLKKYFFPTSMLRNRRKNDEYCQPAGALRVQDTIDARGLGSCPWPSFARRECTLDLSEMVLLRITEGKL